MSTKELRTIAVIGAGTMGHGIAQVSAQAGYDVWLYGVTAELVARARARMADNLTKRVARAKLTAQAREHTPAADPTASSFVLVLKRCACLKKAWLPLLILIKRWSLATTIRWGRCV